MATWSELFTFSRLGTNSSKQASFIITRAMDLFNRKEMKVHFSKMVKQIWLRYFLVFCNFKKPGHSWPLFSLFSSFQYS